MWLKRLFNDIVGLEGIPEIQVDDISSSACVVSWNAMSSDHFVPVGIAKNVMSHVSYVTGVTC